MTADYWCNYTVIGDAGRLENFGDGPGRRCRCGTPGDTPPVAAWMAVAAGFGATESLRTGGAVREVPPVDPELIAYFEGGQRA